MDEPIDDVIEQIRDFYEPTDGVIKQIEPIDDDVIGQIKDFDGICEVCNRFKKGFYWCNCHFQQNFKNWTSGNSVVDEFIQEAQLKAGKNYEILEWIKYDKFEDIKYLAKGGFGIVFKAIWKDGFILHWSYVNNQWKRNGETKVALKCLHNSQGITAQFLKEVRYLYINLSIIRFH
jgi:hypothetical protein